MPSRRLEGFEPKRPDLTITVSFPCPSHLARNRNDKLSFVTPRIYMGCRFTIYSLFLDIHNLFKDIHNSFMDILNSFMDIIK